MTDILVGVAGILLVVAVVVAVEYYRQLRKAQTEYEKAKGAVEDIVLSFNRQLKQEADKLEVVAYKVESAASKNDEALKRAEEVGSKVRALEAKTVESSEKADRVSVRLDEVERKMREVVASHETVATRVASIEEQAKRFSVAPEMILEPVMPIKREKAMARLTETEVSVLEMLVSEGAKTAPEIKEHVKLSREHTARLMKKLYEEGYLERETEKIPFKYSVKKEMENLLKKAESKTT